MNATRIANPINGLVVLEIIERAENGTFGADDAQFLRAMADRLATRPEPSMVDPDAVRLERDSWGAWKLVLSAVQEAAGDGWSDLTGTNLDRVLQFIAQIGALQAQFNEALDLSDDSVAQRNAAVEAVRAGVRMRQTAIVDDDFPEIAHKFDSKAAAVLLTFDASRSDHPRRENGEDGNQVESFLSNVREELQRARAKFPDSRLTMVALAEEHGELAKAVLDESAERVRAEAVQVACMAARVVLDGDRSVDDHRQRHGLDAIGGGAA